MDPFQVYRDMKARTNGEIYIGVVGPVRTGKSTFIKRFMDLLVLPNMTDEHARARTQDELPQSASGTTIMTTEPKFVPKEAAAVKLSEDVEVRIRLIDCVGYMVEGASGHTENEEERQVRTPWFEYEIPFTKAAAIGTQKVIHDHAKIGFVVTTDGSVTGLPRENYILAEEKTIKELQSIGKPFLILLNCQKPYTDEAKALKEEMEKKYGASVVPVNCEQLKTAFGGNFYEVIIGGAAFNREIETLLNDIGFNYTVGYGATECAPIITYADWKEFKLGSCGKAAPRMEIKIASDDPQNTVGEILVRGTNVMLGYYKNEQATAETLVDGWYHTGDLGVMDEEGNVYIKGRSKNMLLGANGQNIYPEEIEDLLNNMTLVNESIVIQNGDKLYVLVYPDFDEAHNLGLQDSDLEGVMEQNRIELNAALPSYSKLSGIKIHPEEFKKTPKKSIKRFLYTDVEI